MTLAAPLSTNFAPNGSSTLPFVHSVVSNYGRGSSIAYTGAAASLFGTAHFCNDIVSNAGEISSCVQLSELNASTATIGAPYNSAISGMRTSVAGDYLIGNTGTIRVSDAGIGNAALTLTSNTIAGANATSAGLAFATTTLALANAINTQEEAEQRSAPRPR